ncbi:OmpA family protein [Myxococcota bacterium]|nr:OmpA family protein [Myxococcota bacterium]
MSASLLLLLIGTAQAGNDQANSITHGIAVRPDTFVVDTRLSTGPVENLTKLYVDAASFVQGLMPKAPLPSPVPAGTTATAPSFPGTGHLLLLNEHLDEAVLSVNGTKVGEVHALTHAIIHDVKSGCYEIGWALNDDYEYTTQACTVASVRPAFPGGPASAAWLETGRPERTEPEWRFGPPDQDKDGLPDSEDECPAEPGSADAFGCPDADGDRVPDVRDACPQQKGPEKADPRRSDGCPARVFIAAKEIVITDKIFFQTNKSTIKPESFALLDELVAILVKHPEVKKVEIAGHTDSQGNDASNLKLSDGRANAVMKYFTDKGIDAARLVAKGYGETQPLADNATEDGRGTNRRVEFRILEQEERVIEMRPGAGAAPTPPRTLEQPAETPAEDAGRSLERKE